MICSTSVNPVYSILLAKKQQLGSVIKTFLLKKRLNKLRFDLSEISSLPDFGLPDIIDSAIIYIESLRCRKLPYGRYFYTRSSKKAILYASVFAALFRHLVKDLDNISEQDRLEWIDYINSHQCDDGLFRDPDVANNIAEYEDWWGWRHLTLLALMALTALRGKPSHELRFLDIMDSSDKIEKILNDLDWKQRVSYTSNFLHNCVASMQFARDFLGQASFDHPINVALDGIAQKCNPDSGLWGSGYDSPEEALSEGVQAGYHFWLLYWYDSLKAPFEDKISTSIIKLQNSYGGFNLKNHFSSACEDIDAVYPLAYLYQKNIYETVTIHAAIIRAIPWIIQNFNRDGGATFRRYSSFVYGHYLMSSKANESSIFATWFRMLSLAYSIFLIDTNLGESKFQFLSCPGYQFLIPNKNT